MPVSKKAFEDQVLAMLGSLHGVARRLCGNESEAEDIVAESIARAWKGRDSLEDPLAFRGWMFRILHNTFVSERRRPDCRLIALEEISEEGVESSNFSLFEQMHQPFLLWFSNPEQEFLDKLLREDLERALSALPEHHRIVVVLSDLEEFNYSEIAAALEIPVGTVRSRLARARGALQKALCHKARERGLGNWNSSEGRGTEKRTSP
jgi:RNA polymerase sigma-70 factor (ECF subfamily)